MTASPSVVAYIGLGANLGDPEHQIRSAFLALAALPQTAVTARSSLYRSAPVGEVAQPDFINAVCAIRTELPASTLLHHLMAIELRHGRTRGSDQWGPRTLDLDLLLYGNVEVRSAELTLPHPRMHERAFVLAPLVEIAPTLAIPGHGAATTLLEKCGAQRIERLA